MDDKLLLLCLGFSVVALIVLRSLRRPPRNLPPGPPPAAIVGNALQVAKKRPWIQFSDWGRQYGDIVHLKVFNRHLIVLNSYQSVVDLFDKRAALYSNRTKRTMAELCGLTRTLLFQNYGDSARQARKMMHSELGSRAVETRRPLQEAEARTFARRLLDDAQNWPDQVLTTSTGLLVNIAYGHQVKSKDDKLIGIGHDVMQYVGEVILATKFLVDSLPIMRYLPSWMPGAAFHRSAKRCRYLLDQFMDVPFDETLSLMDKNTAPPSFTARHMEKRSSMSPEETELVKVTAGNIFSGSDTMSSVLKSFFLAMTLRPDVQKKAQEQLDRVVGEGVLPSFNDRPHLSYIDDIVTEVLRWNPVNPLVSHSCLADDEYLSMYIPANATVIANIWAITHNPDTFPDPDTFNPDRYSAGATIINPRDIVFGYGRRSCPGSALAESFLFIMIATLFSSFEISPHTDAHGKPLLPEIEYTTAAVSHPPSFQCSIRPRTTAIEEALRLSA